MNKMIDFSNKNVLKHMPYVMHFRWIIRPFSICYFAEQFCRIMSNNDCEIGGSSQGQMALVAETSKTKTIIDKSETLLVQMARTLSVINKQSEKFDSSSSSFISILQSVASLAKEVRS